MDERSYTGSGGVEIFGCATCKVTPYYLDTYPAGTYAYLKFKARKGILERVAIKSTFLAARDLVYGEHIVLYKDTWNALYNESELCTLQEAQQIIFNYNELRAQKATEAAKNC